jgi:NAD(P)-dependent dehydrogenase (short-subunit alcohol dehydrogenase family)
MSLNGHIAVVTGASRGVGRAIAVALADEGVAVATVSRTGSDIGQSIQADVSRSQDVDRIKAAVEHGLGRPTVLINAAGIFGPIQPIVESDPVTWIQTLMVNTVAAYLTCRAFVPGMIETGWGRVVNITSAASLHSPAPLSSAYGTSKVALNQFTRHLAAELEGTGVTANVLHPGDLQSAMWHDIAAQVSQLGPEADIYRNWVAWVNQTGGDPPEKAADAVLRIIADGANGEFRWIRDPIQPPIPSWASRPGALPWLHPTVSSEPVSRPGAPTVTAREVGSDS